MIKNKNNELMYNFLQFSDILEDVNLIYKYVGDDPFFEGMKSEHTDKLMNLLLGIRELYTLKFENCLELINKVK